MTTIAGAGPTLIQHLYQRLLDRLNTDGDDALSVGEVGAGQAGGVDSTSTFNSLDADSDGRVMRAEMVPSAAFAAETLRSLVGTQTEASVSPKDEEILAALFARADLDRDGALSAEEMDAEKTIRRAANLDAGPISGPVFMARDTNGDGLFTSDEIGVGHRIQINLQASEKQQQRDQMAVDQAERTSGPEGSVALPSRTLESLRERVRAYIAATEISPEMARRLLERAAAGGPRAVPVPRAPLTGHANA